METSSKVSVVMCMLKEFKEQNLKVLVFSEFRTMLNIIEMEIKNQLNIIPLRIDGKISDPFDRARISLLFNTSDKFHILLITTRAGGMGLNL